ncbi:DUF6986 family protein [Paramicrobacterium agarici]|uniref:DUF6986 family protein n=1 Tax=Paramicrobacterium agarici TaxID=630514 RepID=UPI0011506D70|nr:aldolase [Microbacterium agarici]TQO23718.1 HpcH/HpaI aldolase/citrate lyase family protein [Microbacterium agarici]
MAASLTSGDVARVDAHLAATDRLLETAYPGDDGSRQPIHTVYVPGHRYEPALAARWGADAAAAVAEAGGTIELCAKLGLRDELIAQVAPLVDAKLASEPIEDLRIDFEDGYGDQGDVAEDAAAEAAAENVAAAYRADRGTPFIGIRFKCFEEATRHRGLATLDRFVTTLAQAGPLPDGLILTLPKVTTVDQVTAMVDVCEKLEEALSLDAGRLRFEVQMETPQLILAADGTVPIAQLLHRADGRITSLHYGTYDYSAALQIAAEYQSMEHPAADYAKQVMQVAVAETGVRLSDGSTNIIPVGDPDDVLAAWRLHARLVRRSLERGFYQGWDLHAAQLPTRFIASYAFYRQGLPAATRRLDNYLHHADAGIMDEPATARALARFVLRGVQCGAVTEAEIQDAVGITTRELTHLAHPKLSREENA